MKHEPLYESVILKAYEDVDDGKMAGGLLYKPITDEQKQTKRGIVMAVGHGVMIQGVGLVNLKVKPGDEVMYRAFAGSPFEDDDGEKYTIIREGDILTIYGHKDI